MPTCKNSINLLEKDFPRSYIHINMDEKAILIDLKKIAMKMLLF